MFNHIRTTRFLKIIEKIQDIDSSTSKEYQGKKSSAENEDVVWPEDCLEYFYNNKMFFPGFVRSNKQIINIIRKF